MLKVEEGINLLGGKVLKVEEGVEGRGGCRKQRMVSKAKDGIGGREEYWR